MLIADDCEACGMAKPARVVWATHSLSDHHPSHAHLWTSLPHFRLRRASGCHLWGLDNP